MGSHPSFNHFVQSPFAEILSTRSHRCCKQLRSSGAEFNRLPRSIIGIDPFRKLDIVFLYYPFFQCAVPFNCAGFIGGVISSAGSVLAFIRSSTASTGTMLYGM